MNAMRINYFRHELFKIFRRHFLRTCNVGFRWCGSESRFNSTIFALATGSSRSAVAAVRVSGPHVSKILRCMARLKTFEPRKAILRKIVHPSTKVQLDRGLVIWFPSPHSYTGEDCCELHIHGGAAVISAISEALLSIPGVKHAEPGEFTKRAFLNGKMDLPEVEGLADLLQAETEAQRLQALQQLEGHMSRIYKDWTERLKRCLANVEAFIDFSEDQNIEEDILTNARREVLKLLKEMESHLTEGCRSERLRSGVRIAVIGQPNVGKSSILNAVCQRDVAIVSPLAGTTRDLIESHMNVGGYPVIFCDTAGLRESKDMIEQEGIRRARRWAYHADIKIIIIESVNIVHHVDIQNYLKDYLDSLHLEDTKDSKVQTEASGSSESLIYVINKIDLLTASELEWLEESLRNYKLPFCFTSCTTGDGIQSFVKSLENALKQLCHNPMEGSSAITRERHRHHLNQCVCNLKEYCRVIDGDVVIAAEYLRKALVQIGKITGRVTTEDLLDVIFKDFCIGK